MYDLGYDDLLATITDRFGITVDCFNSRGGLPHLGNPPGNR
jgi:hypothetical protein